MQRHATRAPNYDATLTTPPDPEIARSTIQALDQITRRGAGYAICYGAWVSIRYACSTPAGGLITRVYKATKRDAYNQIIAAGVPLFDLTGCSHAQRASFAMDIPIVCVPPHEPDAAPYGSGDFAPVEVVARMARELGIVVLNVE